MMEVTDKWAYALGDEEDYNDIFYDSKEAALDEAIHEARLEDVQTVWVGQVKRFQPVISIADELLYQLQDQAYEEAGDYSLGWLDNVTKAHQDELDNAIETCFWAWIKAHPEYQTKFFTIFDSREYKVGEEK